MEFPVSSLLVMLMTQMMEEDVLKKILEHLMEL